MKLKVFTKNEFVGVMLIIVITISLTLLNFRVSLRKARDSQRRADINSISDALSKYQMEFGFFPPSKDGKIVACAGGNIEEYKNKLNSGMGFNEQEFTGYLIPCNWGVDALENVLSDRPEFLKNLPRDTKEANGYSYLYLSSRSRFQVYAYMEGGSTEVGFREGIVDRNLKCGINVCNFGKAYGETPLEKSIEEYENELLIELEKKVKK